MQAVMPTKNILTRLVNPLKIALCSSFCIVTTASELPAAPSPAKAATDVAPHYSADPPMLADRNLIQRDQLALLSGAWEGHYICGQGLTSLRLLIEVREASRIDAFFSFFAHPDNPGVPAGSFKMTGSLLSSGQLVLNGTQWVQRPKNYRTVDLLGTIESDASRIRGVVTQETCDTFEIERRRPYLSSRLADWPSSQGIGRSGRDTSRYQQVQDHSGSFSVGIAPFQIINGKVDLLDEPIWPSGQTTFYIHGFNADHTTEGSQIFAEAMLASDSVQQGIMVDWGQASKTAPFGGIVPLGVEQAALRIPTVARALAVKIVESGLSPSQVNLVGHSLGAYVALEAASILNSDQYGFFKVNSVTLLDPATLDGVAGVNRVRDEVYTPPLLREMGDISITAVYDITYSFSEVSAGQGGNVSNAAEYALSASRSVGLQPRRRVVDKRSEPRSHREPINFWATVVRKSLTWEEATRNGRPVRGAPGQDWSNTRRDHLYLDWDDERSLAFRGLDTKTNTEQIKPPACDIMSRKGYSDTPSPGDHYLLEAKKLLGVSGRERDVIALATRSLQDRKSSEAYRYRAWAKKDLGNLVGALADYEASLAASNGTNSSALYGITNNLLALHRNGHNVPSHRIDNVAAYIKALDSASPVALFNLYELYDLRGKNAIASRYLRMAANEVACSHNETIHVARAKRRLGDYDTALQMFGQVISAADATEYERGVAYANRSTLKHHLGDKASACADLMRAVQLGNPYGTSYYRSPENHWCRR